MFPVKVIDCCQDLWQERFKEGPTQRWGTHFLFGNSLLRKSILNLPEIAERYCDHNNR